MAEIRVGRGVLVLGVVLLVLLASGACSSGNSAGNQSSTGGSSGNSGSTSGGSTNGGSSSGGSLSGGAANGGSSGGGGSQNGGSSNGGSSGGSAGSGGAANGGTSGSGGSSGESNTDPACDPCAPMQTPPNTCSLLQACNTSEDCGSSWTSVFTCTEGRCIPSDRFCTTNDECRTWCYEVYGETAAPGICDGMYAPRCEADACGGAQNRCTLLQACTTSEDCGSSWTSVFTCTDGRCIPSDRFCTTNDECRTWCYEVYGETAAPGICDGMYAPRCEADACDDTKSRCTLLQACATSEDCGSSWTSVFTCTDGHCVPSPRSCASDTNCHDWCYDVYGTAASGICDQMYAPKCE